MIDRTALARVSLFENLPPGELVGLAENLRRRHYTKDQIIIAQGDPGTSLFLIESGRVKICLNSPDGKELVLTVLGPGDFFGELALLDGEPRSADAVALEPSQLLLLRREDFIAFIETRPQVMLRLLTTVSRWLRHTAQVARDEAFLDVPARLARVLLDLAGDKDEPPRRELTIRSRMTQGELAAMIGVTRESVNKCLAYFERQGLISREGGIITILRPDHLRRRLKY